MNDLLEAAREARARAYAPYSGFRVGCALRLHSSAVVVGANVENAAYPIGQCAERGAIAAMIAAGERGIAEALVIGSGPEPCTPCGGCRQALREFASPALLVHCLDREGNGFAATLGDLLPHAFGPKDLGADGPAPASAAEIVRARAPGFAPFLGLLLGSGLGEVADLVEGVAAIPYADLPGLPRPGVAGHGGRLVLGTIAGLPVACFEGRAHLYEGDDKAPLRLVRLARSLGCTAFLVTSAVGGIRGDLGTGDIVRLTDHLNLMGTNPLIGPNDDRYGPRFPDMSAAYDTGLAALLDAAAAEGIELKQGVYAGWRGPAFETPAEIRMLRTLGGDVVGMSVVPEALAAAHCGLRFAAVSIVVNRAAGLEKAVLSHEETLKQAGAAAPGLARLIQGFAGRLAREENDGAA
ncbi:MAG: purine-nucleoside phosphorylase [Geminicoccaceae bacterium]|nr:purine-nucleoside phosphorylase [Geminicoccaceae bacterium]